MTEEKPKFWRDDALAVARLVAGHLDPHCEDIEVAGSLRRGKRWVSDVELVYIPRMRDEADGLFDRRMVPETDAALERMIAGHYLAKRWTKDGKQTWGRQIKLAIHIDTGIPVDLFEADPVNWWNVLACRTGPKESNIRVASAARQNKGWHWDPFSPGFKVLAGGATIPVNSERDVFELVGLPHLPPSER